MSVESAPAFESALIVGTGLIGTSIGLRLEEYGVHVGLQDANPENVAIATERGAGRPDEPSDTYDLAIVAVPPTYVASTALHILESGKAERVTDVASTKRLVAADAERQGIDPQQFVPSHPMAGREITGPGAALSDLFDGKAWAVTPLPGGERGKTRETVESLISMCGGIALEFTPEDHDRSVALISHVPHVMASVLAAEMSDHEDSLALTGTGLPGIIRVAGGHPELWKDILTTNADPVLNHLHSLREGLDTFITALEAAREGDQSDLRDRLQAGVDGKNAVDWAVQQRASYKDQ